MTCQTTLESGCIKPYAAELLLSSLFFLLSSFSLFFLLSSSVFFLRATNKLIILLQPKEQSSNYPLGSWGTTSYFTTWTSLGHKLHPEYAMQLGLQLHPALPTDIDCRWATLASAFLWHRGLRSVHIKPYYQFNYVPFLCCFDSFDFSLLLLKNFKSDLFRSFLRSMIRSQIVNGENHQELQLSNRISVRSGCAFNRKSTCSQSEHAQYALSGSHL